MIFSVCSESDFSIFSSDRVGFLEFDAYLSDFKGNVANSWMTYGQTTTGKLLFVIIDYSKKVVEEHLCFKKILYVYIIFWGGLGCFEQFFFFKC